jgi:glutamate/tyrosine decarboxylase-like PLP-dependent enzyme
MKFSGGFPHTPILKLLYTSTYVRFRSLSGRKSLGGWMSAISQKWTLSSEPRVSNVLAIMDSKNRRDLLADAASRAANYLEELNERRVGPMPGSVKCLTDALDSPLPEAPSEPTDIIAFLDEYGSPSTIASAGGRYFGFVTGGALPSTLAANYLAGAWDQNCFSFASSPAIACFEEAALRWVKEALGLPRTAEGALVTGATMAHFTCLAAARNRVLRECDWDVDRHGLFGAPDLAVIVGEEAHASLFKVLSMLGLGRDRVTTVPVDDQGRMRSDRLPAIKGPTIVCVQAGNVNSGAFDPSEQIIEWAHNAGAWAHVDAAFGIWALASPEYAHLGEGVVEADSWALDAHKWLNVPYDSGIAFVRDQNALGQAMSISGSYLLASDRRDAMNFTPDSSRRARAIEIWAALKSLGRSGLADLVNRNCRQAQRLADGLRHDGVEILNEVVLNQVVVAFGDDDRTSRVISTIQDSGVCWCGGTSWHGRAAMRISLSSWATTDDDVERSLSAILEAHRET